MLLATAACNFSTSQLQKVLRDRQFFNILSWKCASRHSGVQFFDIVTSKSGPDMQCFVHFDFKMCFSPQRVQFFDIVTFKSGPKLTCFVHFDFKMCFSSQRRAIFRHLNFKKCSETLNFLAFWLQNVFLATAACNFSTSELQKVPWDPQLYFLAFWLQNALLATAACNFWFLLWPHDSAPAALTSLLFDPPDTRIIGKNTAFRDFSNIWRGWIFFLLTFALLQLLSSDFTSSSDFTFLWLYFIYLLFNSPYFRKFTI